MVWRHVLSPRSLLKDWRKLLRLASASIHERKSHYKPTCALMEKRKEKYDIATELSLSNLFFSSVLRLLIYQKAIRIPQEQQKYVWYVNVYSNPLFCNALFCLSCFLVSIAKKKTILYFFWWKESIRRVYIWDKHWKFIDMILIIIVIETQVTDLYQYSKIWVLLHNMELQLGYFVCMMKYFLTAKFGTIWLAYEWWCLVSQASMNWNYIMQMM